jgi:hypothetical protein
MLHILKPADLLADDIAMNLPDQIGKSDIEISCSLGKKTVLS